jgi:hypothetical protein
MKGTTFQALPVWKKGEHRNAEKQDIKISIIKSTTNVKK